MSWHRPRFISSFWLWFVIVLVINQLLLFAAIRFFLLKPPAEIFADTLLTVNDAVQQIRQHQGEDGLNQLIAKARERGSTFDLLDQTSDQAIETVWYPGMRIIQHTINENSDKQLSAHIGTTPTLTLWLTDQRHQDSIVTFQHKGHPFARSFLVWSVLALLITSGLAGWWISRRVTKPLSDLSEQAHRLATGSQLDAIQVDEKSASPEITALAKALNDMRSELNNTINDREHLLASVTHDLRTPLSRLQIALDMLEPTKPDAVRPMLDDAVEMRMILEQFVELAKLDAEINEPWVHDDLNTFIGRIRDQYRRVGVNLRTVLDESPVVLAYKPIALTRLLYNLVDNACRHGAGSIEISVTREEPDILLQVSNPIHGEQPGTGLTKALAEESGKIPTTGLGLRIAQQFAQVHHAELEEHQSNGIKTFTLRFKAPSLE